MARLLRVLLAASLLVLVPAVVAYADGADEFTRMWDEMWDEGVSMEEENAALHTRFDELMGEVSAIDPTAEDAADALVFLHEAEAVLAEMIENLQSLRVNIDELISMAPSNDVKTKVYMRQLREITELELERAESYGEVLARFKIAWDPAKWDDLKLGERHKLKAELSDLVDKAYRLTARIDELDATALQMYEDATGADPSPPTYVWLLALAAVSALTCGVLARERGLNVTGWAIVGFLAPVIALIAFLIVVKVERLRQPAPATSSDVAASTGDAEGSTPPPPPPSDDDRGP